MAEDRFDKIGPLLAAIGQEAAIIVGGNPDGLFIYAEIGDQWISVDVFRDQGEKVRLFDHGHEFTDLFWDLWEADDPEKRWAVMEYRVDGTKFSVEFQFPSEVDVESMDLDQREIALRKRYGDKPVIYPPIPESLLKHD